MVTVDFPSKSTFIMKYLCFVLIFALGSVVQCGLLISSFLQTWVAYPHWRTSSMVGKRNCWFHSLRCEHIHWYLSSFQKSILLIGREWGLGDEDPKIFNPVKLNTTQVPFSNCVSLRSGSKLISWLTLPRLSLSQSTTMDLCIFVYFLFEIDFFSFIGFLWIFCEYL